MSRALSEIAQINPQVSPPAGAVVSTPVSFVPMSDVTESGDWVGRQVRRLGDVRSGFTAFADGDVLVAKITPCFENGKGAHVVGLTNGVGFGSTEFHVLRAREGVSSRFIHQVTQSTRLRRAAEAHMSGSAGQRRVPREFFDVFKVPDFSPKEQQQIGVVLDTLDATIRQTEAVIEKLKQVKLGLLHDLLTRGIDANGELRPPQRRAPHLYKDSSLGWIPTVWEARPLAMCAAKITDRDHTTPAYLHEGVLMISPVNLYDEEGIDFANAKRISHRAHLINRKKTDLQPGDLVLHRIGAGLGRVRLLSAEMPPFSILHSMAQIRPSSPVMTGEFMLWALRDNRVQYQIELGTQSIGVPDLGLDKIGGLVVVAPSLKEQAAIASVLSTHQRRIETTRSELDKLRALKSGLMDDLLTGRVRVTSLIQGNGQSPSEGNT